MVIKNRTFDQKHEVQVYFQLKHNYSCDQQMRALRRQIFAAATLELWQSRRIKLSSAISLRCSVCLLVYDVKKKKKKKGGRVRERERDMRDMLHCFDWPRLLDSLIDPLVLLLLHSTLQKWAARRRVRHPGRAVGVIFVWLC